MIRKTVEGREFESQMIGEFHFDQTPKEGSFNPVTSDAVAKSIGDVNEAIGDANNELAYIKQLLTNPLNLPANTIRCKFKSGYTPTMGVSQTLVDADENVWDIVFDSAANLFEDKTNLLQVLGANTSLVTNMYRMFRGCTSLVSVPLFDTSSVTNMATMFSGCTSLSSVPLFDTSSVTNFGSCFRNCTSLKSVPLFDTSSAEGINSMFFGCTSLSSVPLFDTSSVTNMSSCFRDCTSLKSVPLFDTSSVTNMYQMCYNCTAVTSGALALYRQASNKLTYVSDHEDAFKNCGANTITGAAELAQIPASWGGTAAG